MTNAQNLPLESDPDQDLSPVSLETPLSLFTGSALNRRVGFSKVSRYPAVSLDHSILGHPIFIGLLLFQWFLMSEYLSLKANLKIEAMSLITSSTASFKLDEVMSEVNFSCKSSMDHFTLHKNVLSSHFS